MTLPAAGLPGDTYPPSQMSTSQTRTRLVARTAPPSPSIPNTSCRLPPHGPILLRLCLACFGIHHYRSARRGAHSSYRPACPPNRHGLRLDGEGYAAGLPHGTTGVLRRRPPLVRLDETAPARVSALRRLPCVRARAVPRCGPEHMLLRPDRNKTNPSFGQGGAPP